MQTGAREAASQGFGDLNDLLLPQGQVFNVGLGIDGLF
jgi:hypothetical protein